MSEQSNLDTWSKNHVLNFVPIHLDVGTFHKISEKFDLQVALDESQSII